MKTLPLLLIAALLASGCTGLPEGAADFGDTVTVRVTVEDVNGTVVRAQRTVAFALGSGESGLGLAFERNVRGLTVGENASFVVSDDPSLGITTPVSVPRILNPIMMHQDAPRADFEASLGPASIGQQFDAFVIYTGTVTGITATRVNFTISTSALDADGNPTVQEDAVPVGAVLVTTPDGTQLQRELRPIVGNVFTIDAPTPQRPAPLGLAPGTYRTIGATDDEIQYAFSPGGAADLLGRDLRFKVTVLRIVVGEDPAPIDGNYVDRDSPYLNGDADALLGAPAAHDEDAGDDHGH